MPLTDARSREERLLAIMRAHPDATVRDVAERVARVPGWTAEELAATLREMLAAARRDEHARH